MELFLNAIKKSYNQLCKEGIIPKTAKQIADENALYKIVISENHNLTATMKSIMNYRLKNDTFSPREKHKRGERREYLDCGEGVEQFKTVEA